MKKSFKLQDLDCAHCASLMENSIAKISGIESASVNFMTQKLIVEINDRSNVSTVIEKIEKAISKIEPDCKIIK
ncbi:MAG: heavy metal-associated domain-containing protein [Methanocorpusculum sp.]|nr:heavy metal-associated domain-containing protein [Methanocorpusculum sp.]